MLLGLDVSSHKKCHGLHVARELHIHKSMAYLASKDASKRAIGVLNRFDTPSPV
jgi:hypothetical protein